MTGTNDPAFGKHAPPTPEELDKLLKSGFASVERVDRVLVPAIVTDRKGRPVLGLTKEDFHLFEDSVPQQIEYFDVGKSERISVAFLLDVSGSMRLQGKIEDAKEAIRYFVTGLQTNDEVALLEFADDKVTTLAPFGSSKALVNAHLSAVKAYGQTALNDAIAVTPSLVDVDGPGRKAIVLITDGIDNASKLSLVEATLIARKTGVPIYTLGFSNSSLPPGSAAEPGAGTNAEVLRRISAETGGTFFWIDDPDEMKEAVVGIEEDLRSEYVLGYNPPSMKCDGSYRRIDLRVGKDRYNVRARKGYVSGPC